MIYNYGYNYVIINIINKSNPYVICFIFISIFSVLDLENLTPEINT